MQNPNEFRMYLRDKNKRPYGVLIARKESDAIVIGWSQCNKRDEWSRERGIEIARARAIKHYCDEVDRFNELASQQVKEAIPRFVSKIVKYYHIDNSRSVEFPRFIMGA